MVRCSNILHSEIEVIHIEVSSTVHADWNIAEILPFYAAFFSREIWCYIWLKDESERVKIMQRGCHLISCISSLEPTVWWEEPLNINNFLTRVAKSSESIVKGLIFWHGAVATWHGVLEQHNKGCYLLHDISTLLETFTSLLKTVACRTNDGNHVIHSKTAWKRSWKGELQTSH